MWLYLMWDSCTDIFRDMTLEGHNILRLWVFWIWHAIYNIEITPNPLLFTPMWIYVLISWYMVNKNEKSWLFILCHYVDDIEVSYHNQFRSPLHYIDVILTTMASQITSLKVVYWTIYSDADQRKHQSSASLAFVWEIHRDRWIPRTKGQ